MKPRLIYMFVLGAFAKTINCIPMKLKLTEQISSSVVVNESHLNVEKSKERTTDNDLQFTSTRSLGAKKALMYFMPDETAPHEGTWLQWPHQYQYGITYRKSLDDTWISMTRSLIKSENVHIIAYDTKELNRIKSLLKAKKVNLKFQNNSVDFHVIRNDDVWVRDNGPIFVRDLTKEQGKQITITDWGFNGWGEKEDYKQSDTVPQQIATTLKLPAINLDERIIVEGGSFEIDGRGTFIATRSSILNSNRNPGMSQSEAEEYFKNYIGVQNFIWLDGVAGLDITDMHIDGFARFGDPHTIVTMKREDLLYWEVPEYDIDTLYNSSDVNDKSYTLVYLPLTKKNVRTAYGKNLKIKGSYVNFYTANSVVLVPKYNDPNDSVAVQILKKFYPDKNVVGVNVRNLYENGGMIHCVTQQQPL